MTMTTTIRTPARYYLDLLSLDPSDDKKKLRGFLEFAGFSTTNAVQLVKVFDDARAVNLTSSETEEVLQIVLNRIPLALKVSPRGVVSMLDALFTDALDGGCPVPTVEDVLDLLDYLGVPQWMLLLLTNHDLWDIADDPQSVQTYRESVVGAVAALLEVER